MALDGWPPLLGGLMYPCTRTRLWWLELPEDRIECKPQATVLHPRERLRLCPGAVAHSRAVKKIPAQRGAEDSCLCPGIVIDQ